MNEFAFNEILHLNEAFLLGKMSPPSVRFRVLKELFNLKDTAKELSVAKQEIFSDQRIQETYKDQNSDGSWGKDPSVSRRILSTIWAFKSLADLGFDAANNSMVKGKNFLIKNSLFEGGVSINGKRDGVFSCYTGIVCDSLAKAGFLEEAQECVNWILNFQECRSAKKNFLTAETDAWADYLKVKYGGCMSNTTCMIGIIKTAGALLEYSKYNTNKNLLNKIFSFREYLLSRQLYKREDGSGVIPLGARKNERAEKAGNWLKITYPVGYICDLVEVYDFVNKSGNYDKRMDSARLFIKSQQLQSGPWPLQKNDKFNFLYIPEKANAKSASYWATFRVLKSMKKD
ncbi:MAG: hypothetical protein WAT19_04075 [Ferruginibacter sp.]